MPRIKLPNSHNLTNEDRSKGGKTVSLYKSLKNAMERRERCSTACMFFEKCPVSAVSYGSPDKKCLMKEFPETVRRQFVDLFLTGEEGIIRAIKTALHNYMNDVDAYGKLSDKRDMVKLMLEFYDKVYNNPRKSPTKKEPLVITMRRVGMEPQTVTIDPHKALPPGVTYRDVINPANDDITEGDPESLANSPMVEQILRPVNRPVPGTLVMEEIKIETNMEDILNDRED